jgi:sugar phosphate isomerase/epimerase
MSSADLASRLGIFARTFRRNTPAEVADAVIGAGYALAHWNFAATGGSTLAADVEEAQFAAVRTAFDSAGLGIPSVSGTFNMIHPDADLRALQIEQAVRLIGLVPQLGARVVTLCTGSRDPDNMWRSHSGNTDPSAWSDLRQSFDPLLEAAREAGIQLGVEPEFGNVVRDARAARRLLDEVGLDAPIGIVLDPANLLTPDTVDQQNKIIGEAIDLLGGRVIGVHAKDVVASGYAAPGAGLMNYPAMFAQLAHIGPVPVIVQDTSEQDAAQVRAELVRWFDQASVPD